MIPLEHQIHEKMKPHKILGSARKEHIKAK